jgi:hypothetical protein
MLMAWYYKTKSNKLEEYKKNIRQITIVSKKVRKIDDQKDYEKSGFKDIMDDVENTKNEALESVPQVPDEQVPTKDETSKELLYGSNVIDNKRDKKAKIS